VILPPTIRPKGNLGLPCLIKRSNVDELKSECEDS